MLAAYCAVTVATTASAIGSSYRAVRGWGAVLPYLASHRLSLLMLSNAAVCAALMVARLLQTVFLGPLRTVEESKLQHKLVQFCLAKAMFCGAMVEHGIGAAPVWGVWFIVSTLLKGLTVLARERLEFLQSLGDAGRMSRPLALMLLVLSSALVTVGSIFVFTSSSSLAVLLAFESACVAVECLVALAKWAMFGRPNSGAVSYLLDLGAECALLVASLLHYVQILYMLGVSFTLIDVILLLNIRSVFSSLLTKIAAYRVFLALRHELEHRYPSVAAADIPADVVCAICREPLAVEAKQLPCTHLYHLECIRGWMEQNQHNCPMCRYDLRKGHAVPAAAVPVAAPRAPPWFLPFAQPVVPAVAGDFDRLREIFPQIDPEVLREELERAGSMEDAVAALADHADVLEVRPNDDGLQRNVRPGPEPPRNDDEDRFQDAEEEEEPARGAVAAAAADIDDLARRRQILHDAAMRRAAT